MRAPTITQAKCNRLMRQALGRPAPKFATSSVVNGAFLVHDSAGRVIGRIADGKWHW